MCVYASVGLCKALYGRIGVYIDTFIETGVERRVERRRTFARKKIAFKIKRAGG